MARSKIAVALPQALLRSIDARGRVEHRTRSAVLVELLEDADARRRDAEVTRRLNQVFEANPGLDRDLGRIARWIQSADRAPIGPRPGWPVGSSNAD